MTYDAVLLRKGAGNELNDSLNVEEKYEQKQTLILLETVWYYAIWVVCLQRKVITRKKRIPMNQIHTSTVCYKKKRGS